MPDDKLGTTGTSLSPTDQSSSGALGAWPDQEDPVLIAACLTGDESAWQALIERYSGLIYSVPFRYGLTPALADEIYQETCLILLEKLATLRDHQRLGAWLITVSKRVCMQHWRRRDQNQFVELQENSGVEPSDLEESLVELEQKQLIQQALSRLPERDQKLLYALFFAFPAPSYEEIAADLGISLGSIGPTRARSLQKLQREITRLQTLQESKGQGEPPHRFRG